MVETLWYSFEITPATGDFMTVVYFNTTVLYTCYSTVHYITVQHCTGQDFKMLHYSWHRSGMEIPWQGMGNYV